MKLFLKVSGVLISLIMPWTLIFISINKDKIDLPTKGHDVKYSVKKNNENLIEIFSDGLDKRYLHSLIIDNKDFKDFLVIEQFANQGKITNMSVPVIFGKYKDYNHWAINRKLNIKNSDVEKYGCKVNSELFAETITKHMNELEKDIHFSKSIINPVNAAQDNSTSSSNVGDFRSITKRDPSINVINWSQARDKILKNGWGIKALSSSGYSYEYAANFAKISKDKPARILINDMITHRRYYDDWKKGIDLFSGNISRSYYALQNYWSKYFSILKKIKGPDGTSAYDNSMIVIYGDHANHNSYDGTSKYGDVMHKENSLLMIKYPHFSNAQKKPIMLNDITVYAPDIKHIIKDYFINKNNYINDKKLTNPIQNKIFNFLKTNSNFKKDKLMINFEGDVMQFNENHDLIKIKHDKRSDTYNFDPTILNEYWGWK